MNFKRLLLPILIVFSQVIFASISDTIVLSNAQKNRKIHIEKSVKTLMDLKNSLSIEDVKEHTEFIINQESILNFQASEATYWLKFIVTNSEPKETIQRYITFSSIDIYTLNYFCFGNDNKIKKNLTIGSTLPIDQRPIVTHEFVFPITLTPNETNTIYFKLDHQHQIISTFLSIVDDAKLVGNATHNSYVSGVVIGSLIIFILIALSLFIFFKQAIHFNYIIYLLGALIFFLSYNEGNRYIWNNYPNFQDSSQYIGPTILLVGFIGVFKFFFRVKKNNSFLNKIFNGIQFLGILLAFSFLFWTCFRSLYFQLYQFLGVLFFISFSLFFVTGFYVLKKEKKSEYVIFLISMIFLVISSLLIIIIEQSNLLSKDKFNFVFTIFPIITIYFEAIILCFFLVQRVYIDKIRYQKRIIQDRQSVIESLHDEVISSLGSIKNSFANLSYSDNQEKTDSKLDQITDRIYQVILNIRNIARGMDNKIKFLDQVIAETRRYTYDLYENNPNRVEFNFYQDITEVLLPVQIRRNLLGFFKEIIFNSFKHSEADNFKIDIKFEKGVLSCDFKDDGVGFDLYSQNNIEFPSGMGFFHLKKRAERMKANFYELETSASAGVFVLLKIKFENFTETDYI